jgi:hypothetical protein
MQRPHDAYDRLDIPDKDLRSVSTLLDHLNAHPIKTPSQHARMPTIHKRIRN